jgi:hypothetical protein
MPLDELPSATPAEIYSFSILIKEEVYAAVT